MTARVNRPYLKCGPKPRVDSQKAQEALSLLRSGELFNDTARTIGAHPITLRKALVREGLRLPYQKLRAQA